MQSISWRACAAGIAVIALSACGGGGSSSTAPSSVPSGAVTITINGQTGTQSFSPNPASAGGQMVVFKNNDTVTHHVVLNDGTIDTGDIAPGATSKAVLMPSSGTNYHCSLHAGMVGSVAGASGDAPTCDGPYCSSTYF